MAPKNNFSKYLFEQNQKFRKDVPSIISAHDFIDNLIHFLFPIMVNKECTKSQMELAFLQMQLDFKKLIKPLESILEKKIDELSDKFFAKVPTAYDKLIKDAHAFMNFDPAARSIESVIAYYPGFYAIAVYRISNILYKLDIPYVPRMISEYAHSKTGIDIHSGATIGEPFFIDHGTGVVIGETTNIGNNVKIYQGVTLGALYVAKKLADTKRHPTIEDDVIIYSGSTILGGETIVGHDSVIGGNVWLTKSVAPFSLVYNESTTVVRDKKQKNKSQLKKKS